MGQILLDALRLAEQVGRVTAGNFRELLQRLDGLRELICELGVLLVLPRVAQRGEARLERGHAVLEFRVEALQFLGETPDLLGIHDSLGHYLTVLHVQIEAARSLGAGQPFIIGAHVLPNSIAPSIVQLSLALSWAILTEAALSFLGLGTLPPNPSWGSMLSESRTLMELAPWMAITPGIAIMFGVLGFNLLGDGLRDVLDPRMHTGTQA